MNKKTVWWVVAIIVVVIVAAGAYHLAGKTPSGPDAAANPVLDGTSFTLVSYDGAMIPEGETYSVSFEESSIHAQFCNSMNGPYALANGVVTSMLAATQKFCAVPANLMSIESAFGQMLAAGASATREGDTLMLANGTTTMVFTVSPK